MPFTKFLRTSRRMRHFANTSSGRSGEDAAKGIDEEFKQQRDIALAREFI